MKSEKSDQIRLSSELDNIASIRAAEQEKREALAKAGKTVAEKLASAAHEAEKIKEQMIGEARAERKSMVQKAIDQAKIEVNTKVAGQEHASEEMLRRGEKWISKAADFAVSYILGTGRENPK